MYLNVTRAMLRSGANGLIGAVVVLLAALPVEAQAPFDYRVLATSKTSTLEKELREAGAAGYEVMGLTVSKTVVGGKELVAITRKAR